MVLAYGVNFVTSRCPFSGIEFTQASKLHSLSRDSKLTKHRSYFKHYEEKIQVIMMHGHLSQLFQKLMEKN